jgi:hypothetical protein
MTGCYLRRITFFYVVLTLLLVTQSGKAVIKSEEAIAQSKKEQQIRDIEHRLEKFYIPADDILNSQEKFDLIQTIEGSHNGLKTIRKYSYLADKKTYEAYDTYISKNFTDCTYTKNKTCKIPEIFEKCTHKTEKKGSDPHSNYSAIYCFDKSPACPYNKEYCKYHPDCNKYQNDCGNIDKINCPSDNTLCHYYVELKERITEDIEKYKKKLLELKE